MDENRVEGVARNFGGKIQEAVGDITGDADTQVRGKVNQAAGRVQNALGGAADEIENFAENLADTVRERPLTSVAVAVGVGVLIGMLVQR